MAAAQERGITVTGTGYDSSPAIELRRGLILASARHIVQEDRTVRKGGNLKGGA
jgi:lactate dehydrogenase-like 2-hydroxyacid dehydrogenase